MEELLKEQGAHLDHATVARWVQIYGAELEKRLRRQRSKVGTSWRVDETYVKLKGEGTYLYRAGQGLINSLQELSKTDVNAFSDISQHTRIPRYTKKVQLITATPFYRDQLISIFCRLYSRLLFDALYP